MGKKSVSRQETPDEVRAHGRSCFRTFSRGYNRGDAVKRAEKAGKALAKARKQAEEDDLQIETLKVRC